MWQQWMGALHIREGSQGGEGGPRAKKRTSVWVFFNGVEGQGRGGKGKRKERESPMEGKKGGWVIGDSLLGVAGLLELMLQGSSHWTDPPPNPASLTDWTPELSVRA